MAEGATATHLNQLWKQCLHLLEENHQGPLVQMLSQANPVNFQDGELTLDVPGHWLRDFLSRNDNRQAIEAVLTQVLGERPMAISFKLSQIHRQPHGPQNPVGTTPDPPEEPLLNPRYTFESFVRGNENRLAAAAAEAVANKPGITYNPLFIYGGVGLGKTHLIHAIGNHVWANRRARVAYVSSERFTNELVHAIQIGQTKQFRDRYRNVDVLLIDDVQFLRDKERTQEEFFHTFNELHGAAKQIVMTSDQPPRLIVGLEDRLRTRFEMGMLADIQLPDLETRMAILRKKAEQYQLLIPHEVTSYLAEQIPSNIRELEGALTRVVAYCSIHRRPVNLENTVAALGDMFQSDVSRPLDIHTIQEEVCKYFKMSRDELLGKRREQRLVGPRHIAMYLCKLLTDASYPDIGREFGGRDHTTVIHAYKKVEERRADPYYKTHLTNLENLLKKKGRSSG